MKKRKIFYWALGIVGCILFIGGLFVAEQYYRWEVCNFESRDGEAHSYLVYEGTSLDSVLNMLREDYDISAETETLHLPRPDRRPRTHRTPQIRLPNARAYHVESLCTYARGLGR